MRRLASVLAVCGLGALVAAPPAGATPLETVSMLASPSYTGGVPAQTGVFIQNSSSAGEAASFPEIFVAPGCATGGAYCAPTEGREPGLFTLSATGTGTGGGECSGTWSIVELRNNPGVWRLVPGRLPSLILAAGEECVVLFTATANRMPLTDVDLALDGVQTYFVLTVRPYFFDGAGTVHTAADETPTTVLRGAPAAAVPTGQRAAALKKCKKKRSKKARKKCKRRARRLPV